MFRKRKYLSWDNYKDKIDFIDMFYWQQDVRRQNLRNTEIA